MCIRDRLHFVPSSNPSIPDIRIEYTLSRPWIYSHKDSINTFSSANQPLGYPFGPSSDLISISSNFYPSSNIYIKGSFNYYRKGSGLGSSLYQNYIERDPDLDNDGWDFNRNKTIDPWERYTNYEEFLNGTNPRDNDTDGDDMPDGWEYCYSVYSEVIPVNSLRWSLNPINPLDVAYDPDSDGWLDREIIDTPAIQGKWVDREFSPFPADQQFGNAQNSLYFTNIMEYENGTGPLDPDSDSDSIIMSPVFQNGIVVDYVLDLSLSDGCLLYTSPSPRAS